MREPTIEIMISFFLCCFIIYSICQTCAAVQPLQIGSGQLASRHAPPSAQQPTPSHIVTYHSRPLLPLTLISALSNGCFITLDPINLTDKTGSCNTANTWLITKPSLCLVDRLLVLFCVALRRMHKLLVLLCSFQGKVLAQIDRVKSVVLFLLVCFRHNKELDFVSSLCLVVCGQIEERENSNRVIQCVDIAWILNNTTKQRLNTKPCESPIVSHAKGMAIAQGFWFSLSLVFFCKFKRYLLTSLCFKCFCYFKSLLTVSKVKGN